MQTSPYKPVLQSWIKLNDLLLNMDVNNAFSNRSVDEIIYMLQPPRFESADKTLVYWLNKGIYGLKQVSRQWFLQASNCPLETRLFSQQSRSISICLYTSSNCPLQTYIFYILVCVDDIIIIGSYAPLLHQITRSLHSHFSLKKMGNFEYFSGIESIWQVFDADLKEVHTRSSQ